METKKITTWHLFLTFLFPVFYFLLAMTPWGVELFGKGNRDFYVLYWIGVMVLHWISAGLVFWFLKRDGLSLKDLDFGIRKKGAIILVCSFLAFALLIFFFVESMSPDQTAVQAGVLTAFYPVTTNERLLWILCCFTAGFCEELVYRGYNISMLRFKGVNKWLALFIAAFPFVFIHSFAAISSVTMFATYFVAALIFGLLYLLTRRLWVPIAVHCVYNLTAMMAVLGPPMP